MKTVEALPCRIAEHRHVRIEMRDGVTLSARLWLPDGAEERPVPAILEYIPYRKNDHTARRDSIMHRYFCGHGYAAVRVDIRGSGDSGGVLQDEYLQSELDDGVEVLRWIGAQPWCTGDVGMIGISWGGFNGLQIAAMQPPELKVVVSACSTDDRYADDVHYMGGCLLGDNVSWAAQMFAYNAMPPDPAYVGDAWREMWLQRLRANEPWLATWLEHQHRDEYWRHGSICEDWGAVRCPVMAVSGWADGYTNAVFRLMENLQVPRLGLIGPWSHKYPHLGQPGPAIGFLQECLRWWDHWLKGRDSGIMEEPMIRAWMQESVPPTTRYAERPGRWVGERHWPAPDIAMKPYLLASAYRLLEEPEEGAADPLPNLGGEPYISVISPLSTGLFAGKWCSYAATPDLPHDQRQEDGGALVFSSGRLREDLEVFGAPVVEIEYEADQPVALVAVRLSDVHEDDKATRVTYGLANLTHAGGDDAPAPLDTGRRHRAQLQLNHLAQVFPKGHRIRISISTSYWPLAWPAPHPTKLRIFTGASRLYLPVRRPRADDAHLSFPPPEGSVAIDVAQLSVTEHNWHVIYDLARDAYTLHVVDDNGVERIPDADLDYEDRTEEWYSSVADDFESICAEVRTTRSLRRHGGAGENRGHEDWHPRMVTRTRLTCTEDHFRLIAELDAYEGEQRIFSRNWDRRIPRRCL